MSWQDMFLNRLSADDEITNALSSAFDVDANTIVVTHEYPDLTLLPKNTCLACWVDILPRGDFPTRLKIFPMKKELIPEIEWETEKQICKILNRQALIADAELNPYSWALILGSGEVRHVKVDPDLLDADESGFVIVFDHGPYAPE